MNQEFRRYTLGIDIGSASTKAVVMNSDKSIIAYSMVQAGTGTDGPNRVLAELFDRACINMRDIAYTIATGYGRVIFKNAEKKVSEITCHARGVYNACPNARTVIDIGGQDIKVIRVTPEGYVSNFIMNDKCAAGTGRFLEVMARTVNIKITDMGNISEKSKKTVPISSICTVFAESEVISHLSRGESIPDIISGIHESVAKRTAGLVSRIGPIENIVITGGVANNSDIVNKLIKELHMDVVVAPFPQYTGAIGAALIAWEMI